MWSDLVKFVFSVILAILVGIILFPTIEIVIPFLIKPYVGLICLLIVLSISLLVILFFTKVSDRKRFISLFVALTMLLVPPLGVWSYLIFIKVYHNYMGGTLSFGYPTFVWYLGVFSFIVGVSMSNAARRTTNGVRRIPLFRLDYDKLEKFLFLFAFISFLCTIVAIMRIGYVPILRPDIESVRFSFGDIAGDNIVKFSHMWLIVALLSSLLYFVKKRKFYLVWVFVAIFGLLLYGQRQYALVASAAFFLLRVKIKSIKILSVVVLIGIVPLLYSAVDGWRAATGREIQSLSSIERVVSRTFGEWLEYSYVVNKFHGGAEQFVGGKFIAGALAAFIPKEVFSAVGANKFDYLDDNPAAYFGRYFGHYAGIRIGIIGEWYASFGCWGVALIMGLIGVITGILENLFIKSSIGAPFLLFYVLILANILFLPLLTFINLTHMVAFYGFFLMLIILLCLTREKIEFVEDS
ncbi:MAG: O-antigen polymerase [Candidatus Aceula meridiana]|nr:O-antigen polymerase [Candidatus Aceula meridiana]